MNPRIASFVLAATLTIPTASADTPFLDTNRPKNFISLGIHVGDGASTIIQNYSDVVPSLVEFSLAPGNTFCIGADALIPIRNFFGVGTAIDFSISNYDWNMSISDPEAGTLNAIYSESRFYTLDFPVFLDFSFNLGSKVRWHNEIGAYMSVGLGGTTRTRSYASFTNALGQSQVTESVYKRDYFKDPDPIINGINDLDWGLHLASGFVIARHFSIKAVIHVGARNIAQNHGVLAIKTHNLSALVKAGYIF